MMTSLPRLLVSLFCFNCAVRAADDVGSVGALGRGEHFPYDLNVWKGKEQLITKLTKADEVYEFARVSKEEFQIRQAGDKGEIFSSLAPNSMIVE